MSLSHETRHALNVIRDYLEGQGEAVQYELEFMADQVTETSSGVLGGFQAGNVPATGVVTDTSPEVFTPNAPPAGTPSGSVSLDLGNGQLAANWNVGPTLINVAGETRCIASLSNPSARFLFVIEASGKGFFVLTTTNI